mgnify:CR=1 FL=1
MKALLTSRAILLASAIAVAPAAFAQTPADVLVVAATIDDIITLDPAQSFEFSGNDVTQNLYDRLVDFDPMDMEAGFKPSLAESWEISEDGKTITFKMRDGVKFHSGNPVRAEDAAWSIQRAGGSPPVRKESDKATSGGTSKAVNRRGMGTSLIVINSREASHRAPNVR